MNLGPEFLQPLEDFALFFFFFFFFCCRSKRINPFSQQPTQSEPLCPFNCSALPHHPHWHHAAPSQDSLLRCSFRSPQTSTAVSVIRVLECLFRDRTTNRPRAAYPCLRVSTERSHGRQVRPRSSSRQRHHPHARFGATCFQRSRHIGCSPVRANHVGANCT